MVCCADLWLSWLFFFLLPLLHTHVKCKSMECCKKQRGSWVVFFPSLLHMKRPKKNLAAAGLLMRNFFSPVASKALKFRNKSSFIKFIWETQASVKVAASTKSRIFFSPRPEWDFWPRKCAFNMLALSQPRGGKKIGVNFSPKIKVNKS